jgi:hypothetical protein
MKEEIEENLELIAVRVPPGDSWQITDPDYTNPGEVIVGLVETLTHYMRKTGFKGAYRLEPLKGKLFAIKETTIEVEEKIPPKWDLYGEQ